jgi:ribulose 1,5-bisphosphate synthetase/thiazole synthase
MFPQTIVAVVAFLGAANALPNDVAQVHKRVDKNTYDYVIVGGGITGLVAANRLSEDKKSKLVLVFVIAERNTSL